MRIDIITIYPEFFDAILSYSIIKRSQEKGFVKFFIHNLRDYASNKYRSVDDYPYGGGAGMVIMIEPVAKAIEKLTSERKYDEIIYTSPEGELLNQKISNQLSTLENIIILCGHFKGIDERIREHYITTEISIGDYVLSGGELAAAVLCDSVVRLIPGVLGDETSALSDSFQDGLLAPPVYTRPAVYNGWKVPDVLLSGHDAEIAKWRFEQQLERTRKKRPDLFKEFEKNI